MRNGIFIYLFIYFACHFPWAVKAGAVFQSLKTHSDRSALDISGYE